MLGSGVPIVQWLDPCAVTLQYIIHALMYIELCVSICHLLLHGGSTHAHIVIYLTFHTVVKCV